MKKMKLIGIILIVVGGAMLLFSDYIARQVAEGRLQIQSGQSQVDTANSLFNRTETTKPIGKAFTGGAQKRIDAGQREVDKYSTIATNVKIIGFVLIGIGAVLVFLPRRKR